MSRGMAAEQVAQKETRPRFAACIPDPVGRATW